MGQEKNITTDEVVKAQKTWARWIVAIGKAYIDGDDYVRVAEEHLDTLYAFADGPVLFKPTRASETQFRTTREAALSYFVGGNETYREDHGFAIHPWAKVRFENVGIFLHGEYAVAMGNYFFTETNGNEVKVEYTFGYLKDQDGRLKIHVHHSSIPYSTE